MGPANNEGWGHSLGKYFPEGSGKQRQVRVVSANGERGGLSTNMLPGTHFYIFPKMLKIH